jgi:hypothetical protein
VTAISAAAPLSLTLTLTGPRHSANDRHHWARKAGLTQIWRDLGHGKTLAAIQGAEWRGRLPLHRAHALVEVVPHSRGRVDPANTAPAVKAAVDGMVLAGLLYDDDAAHLLGPDFRRADVPVRQQRGLWTLRITVTELAADGAP